METNRCSQAERNRLILEHKNYKMRKATLVMVCIACAASLFSLGITIFMSLQ